MNKKDCIDELKYIRKTLSTGTIYQYDAIIWIIDTMTRYLEESEPDEVESGKTV